MGPNVKNNALPMHGNPIVNVIEEEYNNGYVIENFNDVITLLVAFHARLLGDSLISACHDNCEEYVIHLRGCEMVQADIQDQMD